MKPILYGLRVIPGYRKRNLVPFGFTDDEISEVIEEDQDEDSVIEELEDEWRKSLPSREEREKIFEKEMGEYVVLETKRNFLLERFTEKTKRGEDTRREKVQYEIVTGKLKNAITDSMVEIAKNVPVKNILEQRGIKVTKGFAPCPFHEEKTPSFHITKNLYYCFSCQESGDTIKLVQKLYNYSFKDAIKFLQ